MLFGDPQYRDALEMSLILDAQNGGDVQINMWHWRPTILLVRDALKLDDERFEKLHVNGIGATVSAQEAHAIADYLDTYLETFPQDGRLLLDGSITTRPRVRESDAENWHSAGHQWLVQFRDFCRSSGGFKVV